MSVVVFSDIDDTLIESVRKCPSALRVKTGAIGRKGQVVSYMRWQHTELLRQFSDATIIPVTGRQLDSLNRVGISFKGDKVVSHGAMIVNDKGQPLSDWLTQYQPLMEKWQPILTKWYRQLYAYAQQHDPSIRCRLVKDFDYACYISIKGDAKALTALKPLVRSFCAAQPQARLHHNDRDMALLPPFASKRNAVSFLIDKYRANHGQTLFIGVGDSHSDLGFMQLCDFVMAPVNSQIVRETLA